MSGMRAVALVTWCVSTLALAACQADPSPAPTTSTAAATQPAFTNAERQYIAEVRGGPDASWLSDELIVKAGHRACQSVSEGEPITTTRVSVVGVSPSINSQQAALMIIAAPPYLCPEYKDIVRRQIVDLAAQPG